ncbi:MAG: hypothetical protein QOH81_953 [Sphingomonadales bacterium]|jgi:hypothetical protein|nr:hypothetical protein [Sphingomonadales bacterium]
MILRQARSGALRDASSPGSGPGSAAPQDERDEDEREQDDRQASDEKILAAARDDYKRARDAWNENQQEARADLEFARLGRQWDVSVEQQRRRENRPCLTFNKMPAFIRQVVNDARQNKPAIKVHPQDSGADRRVAEIYNGLIRNIEAASDADVAYDTAIEHAVGQGFGFWRINTRYTSDDAFDQDIVVERVSNPFAVYGDPRSTAADSSDWNSAFVITTMSKEAFERDYPEAERTNWEYDFADCPDWLDGEDVVLAEYWTREKVAREIVALSDGAVVGTDELAAQPEHFAGLEIVGRPRRVESWKVTQRLMTGAEILKTVDWAGKYIPIVPVYGDEVVDENGRRHFRSLIRDAKSAQQMFNYWRTTTTELVALAPKAPWVGEEKAFSIDPNWDTANSASHAKLMVPNGARFPERMPFAGVPAGALQEALNANDDMKAIIGIYDASLGARSNETSGRAIMARQREGDVSTFHFIDNLSRAIRHGGRILLDLIPRVYTTERMVRVLGEDLAPANVAVAPTGQAVTPVPNAAGETVAHIFDLAAGKYDLSVSSGPAYTTRRAEASDLMMQMMQAAPQVIPLIADLWVEQQDMPLADRLAERFRLMLPPQAQGAGSGSGGAGPGGGGGAGGGLPPAVQQQIQEGLAQLQQLQQENATLRQALRNRMAETQVKSEANQIHAYEAQTERMRAVQPPGMVG